LFDLIQIVVEPMNICKLHCACNAWSRQEKTVV